MSRYLFIAGGLPFLILGIAHALLTPNALLPRNPAIHEAMAKEPLRLTRRMTLWRGWLGFNFSHSLGAILFGSLPLLIGRNNDSFQQQGAIFVPVAVVVSVVYLILGIRYWFRIPTIGIAMSCICFVTSWFLLR